MKSSVFNTLELARTSAYDVNSLLEKRTRMSEQFDGNVTKLQRNVSCPSCQGNFAYRNFLRSRACPSCKVSLGFSVPYRVELAIFATAVFLYCSYEAVLAAGIVLSVVWLILAAPVALIARLFFISNVPSDLHAIGIARCPICDGVLTRVVIRPGPFDCPHCLKRIRPVHRTSYHWMRGGLCAALAIATAKFKGFDWSFLVFVVSLYALPALFFWDIFALDLSPPMRFEATKSSVQILGIGKD